MRRPTIALDDAALGSLRPGWGRPSSWHPNPTNRATNSGLSPTPKSTSLVPTAARPAGVPDPAKPDQGSTTGTTPDDEYVGRVAGQDVGYAGETGAEARAE